MSKAKELYRSPKFSFSRIREVSTSENASRELLGEEAQELAKVSIRWRVFSKEVFTALLEAEKDRDEARAQLNKILGELPNLDDLPVFTGNIPLHVTAVISKLQEKAFAYDLGIEWAGIESSDEDAVEPV